MKRISKTLLVNFFKRVRRQKIFWVTFREEAGSKFFPTIIETKTTKKKILGNFSKETSKERKRFEQKREKKNFQGDFFERKRQKKFFLST